MVVCWRLDRLGRNLKHLVTLLDELQALGVAFISMGEGIDCTTPAGKLQPHILAAHAEFERGRIQERVKAGWQERGPRVSGWAARDVDSIQNGSQKSPACLNAKPLAGSVFRVQLSSDCASGKDYTERRMQRTEV